MPYTGEKPATDDTPYALQEGVEVMGRDISILSENEASQNPVIRSIVSADSKRDIDVSAETVAFSLKPHKVFLFDHESEERIAFDVL